MDNKSPTALPQPQCCRYQLVRASPKHWYWLASGDNELHFWQEDLMAVVSAGIVHFRDGVPPAAIKAINQLLPSAPHIRESADSFDFIVGQTLIKAGLPLTRRPE